VFCQRPLVILIAAERHAASPCDACQELQSIAQVDLLLRESLGGVGHCLSVFLLPLQQQQQAQTYQLQCQSVSNSSSKHSSATLGRIQQPALSLPLCSNQVCARPGLLQHVLHIAV
jgi:hypothetical protein